MSEEIVKSEEYEEMAAAFQCSQIQVLDNVLSESGISPTKAKEIVESFALKYGVVLDQYWLDSEEGKVFPAIAFSKKHQEYEPDTFYMNEGAFSFAEYAYGNISWYYEDNANKQNPQVMGVVGEDGCPA
ncbi:MAG: hypothetical protein AB2809_13935 [Candidatus Thiodiazotropha sp.]